MSDSDARLAFDEGSNPAFLINSHSAPEIKWTQRINVIVVNGQRLGNMLVGASLEAARR